MTGELLEGLVAEGADRATRFEGLSPRQQEILILVAEGLTNAQIAKRLWLSESTIKQHLRRAYKILDVKSSNEATKLFRDFWES